MYKVFIDQRPVIFISSENSEKSLLKTKYKSDFSIKKDLKNLLPFASISNPIFIVCDNVKEDFRQTFLEYAFIEAAGGIVKRKNKYLIIKRNGKWDIPKGKIDKGESKKAAAVREIEEECGISNPVIESKLVSTYHIFNHKGKKALKKTYWYMLSYSGPKDIKGQLEEGITKVKWVDYSELLSIRKNTYGSINSVLDAFIEHQNL